MVKFNSKDSIFQITDTGASLRDISTHITNIDGIPGERELNEVTGLGDAGRKWIPGLENVTITLEGVYDTTASTGPDVVLGPLRTNASATAWDYGPEGKSSTETKYSGNCYVRRYEIISRVGDQVIWRAELQVDGVVTRGTY